MTALPYRTPATPPPRPGTPIELLQRRERFARVGRVLEIEVERVLLSALDTRGAVLFFEVVRYEPNSAQDAAGKDFLVALLGPFGWVHMVEFGITVSRTRRRISKKKHPDVPQLWMPRSISHCEIVRLVLDLFPPEFAERVEPR